VVWRKRLSHVSNAAVAPLPSSCSVDASCVLPMLFQFQAVVVLCSVHCMRAQGSAYVLHV
jgi:hypothetical protein